MTVLKAPNYNKPDGSAIKIRNNLANLLKFHANKRQRKAFHLQQQKVNPNFHLVAANSSWHDLRSEIFDLIGIGTCNANQQTNVCVTLVTSKKGHQCKNNRFLLLIYFSTLYNIAVNICSWNSNVFK